MSGDVHPLPERKDLPPEIAALAVDAEDPDEPATVILNANEGDLGAAYREIRPGILIPGLLGWAGEWTREMVREYPITVAVTSSVSAAALVAIVQLALDNDNPPPVKPQPSIVSVLPTSPTSRTATPTASPRLSASTSPSAPTTSPSWTPHQSPEKDEGSGGAPSARSTRRPSQKPSSTDPTPSEPTPSTSTAPSPQAPAPQPSDDNQSPNAGAAEAPATPPPPQTQAPDPSKTARTCAVRVDLDPLLNVCVLS